MTEYEKFKEQTMRLLGEIIRSESVKPDNEADFKLIDECEELLCELVGVEAALSDKDICERINMITKRQSKMIVSSQKPRRRISRAAAILCAAMLLCVSVGAVCMIRPEIRNGILTVLKLNVGESVDIDGITFTNNGISKTYSTIEEFLEENAIDIMYPHELPEGVQIEGVYTRGDKNFPIDIVFTDPWCSISVYPIGTEEVEKLKSDTEAMHVGDKIFYVKQIHEYWIALISDEFYTYYISYSSEVGLQKIMKGFR